VAALWAAVLHSSLRRLGVVQISTCALAQPREFRQVPMEPPDNGRPGSMVDFSTRQKIFFPALLRRMTILLLVGVAVVSVVGTYLFLRANPRKRATLDRELKKLKRDLEG
jgi:hypothetical protein